jgi:DNA-binding NarL/FixJ family response regulator
MDKCIGILVVFSRSLAAELLISALSSSPRFQVVGHATDLEDAVETLKSGQVEVAIIDSEWEADGVGHLQLLERIREESRGVKPLVLLHKRDPEEVVACFRNGAKGIFSKSSADFKLLCKCVECVHKGQIWASTEELGWLLAGLEATRQEPVQLRMIDARGVNLLSKREEDVVRLLMEGLSNREIASSLSLSEHTIKNYLFRIFDKLGVSNRMELLLYAIRTLKADDAQTAKSQVLPDHSISSPLKTAAAAAVPVG